MTFPPWLRFSFKKNWKNNKKRPDGVAVQDRYRLLWTSLWWYTKDPNKKTAVHFSTTKKKKETVCFRTLAFVETIRNESLLGDLFFLPTAIGYLMSFGDPGCLWIITTRDVGRKQVHGFVPTRASWCRRMAKSQKTRKHIMPTTPLNMMFNMVWHVVKRHCIGFYFIIVFQQLSSTPLRHLPT